MLVKRIQHKYYKIYTGLNLLDNVTPSLARKSGIYQKAYETVNRHLISHYSRGGDNIGKLPAGGSNYINTFVPQGEKG